MIASVGSLEVRGLSKWAGVTGSVFACPVQCDERGQAVRYAREDHCVDLRLHQGLVCPRIGCAVGVGGVLVGAPGGLEGNVLFGREQVE